jgi:glycosyltransferase involved in cell wall biosynthesis
MRIAAVSVIKDECDIIELFIRLNAQFVDHHYIVDDGSSDATLEILSRLKAEGYPLSVRSSVAAEHAQRIQATAAMRQALKTAHYDWWLNLDADEFLLGDRAALGRSLGRFHPGIARRCGG